MGTPRSPSFAATLLVLRGVAVVVVAIAVSRLIFALLWSEVPRPYRFDIGLVGRPGLIKDHLDDMARVPEDLVLLLGQSAATLGFSPEQFDRAILEGNGRRVRSFNLGWPFALPETSWVLARAARKELERNNRRASLTMIEFVVDELTAKFEHEALRDRLAVNKAIFLDLKCSSLSCFREDWAMLTELDDPERLLTQIVAGRQTPILSSEMFSHVLGVASKPRNPKWAKVTDFKNQIMLLADEAGNFGDRGDWVMELGGEIKSVYPPTAELYPQWLASIGAAEGNEEGLKKRSAGYYAAGYDPERLADFIRFVEEAKTFSDKVVIVVFPFRYSWMRTKWDVEVLNEIVSKTGVTVLYDGRGSPDYELDDYMDSTHLNETKGRPKMTRRLASEAIASGAL